MPASLAAVKEHPSHKKIRGQEARHDITPSLHKTPVASNLGDHGGIPTPEVLSLLLILTLCQSAPISADLNYLANMPGDPFLHQVGVMGTLI